ncbi:hypothetical protein GpartN1_g3037.t1 [Galdieria partita]|uniref:Uncharacterized protein n=1 Tax=Galdieria partita TaxID=83374 RepID=A0A9C7UQ37_9RHOD|nr:hypothetical protein GpartN1_g3037.t1 [Galdieria partita]
MQARMSPPCDQHVYSPLIQLQTHHTFSPASFLSSRLGANIEYGSVFVASGTKVYHLNVHQILLEQKGNLQEENTRGGRDLNRKRSNRPDSSSDSLVQSHLGTTKNWVPQNISGDFMLEPIKHISHRYEIQSLQVRSCSNKEFQVATVDGWGRAVISVACCSSEDHLIDYPRSSYTIAPISMEDGEEGWAGLDLDPCHLSRTAIVRQFFRDLTIYDKDLATRQLALSYTPHAVRFLSRQCNDISMDNNVSNSICHLVACLEGSYLSIWDTRVGEGGGRIHHKCYGNGSLYGIDMGQGGSIAVGGVDRMVSILDPRTWNVRCRWNNCLKYECKHILFPEEEDCWHCIVIGVDNELSCGFVGNLPLQEEEQVRLSEKRPKMMSGANLVSCKRIFGFRADSRWIGVTKQFVNGYNHILGMSENGFLYWLRMKTLFNTSPSN